MIIVVTMFSETRVQRKYYVRQEYPKRWKKSKPKLFNATSNAGYSTGIAGKCI